MELYREEFITSIEIMNSYYEILSRREVLNVYSFDGIPYDKTLLATGRKRIIGCLVILIGHFLQKSSTTGGSLQKETCNFRHSMHFRYYVTHSRPLNNTYALNNSR